MDETNAIFIFTRNRPRTLINLLNSIDLIDFPKYIVDDSTTNESQKEVSKVCSAFLNCFYLGKLEYRNFVSKNHIDSAQFLFMLRELGHSNWNLGYARNFALLYSKLHHFNGVLFIDDDIRVPNLELICVLFQKLPDYQFVGANIVGLVDDSVLGHIASDLEIYNERMLSGGFLLFNPNKINQYFFNNYNEDWIWLFLQMKNNMYLQTGEVFQELSDPLSNYKDKIIFQEFGEIALDGILDLYPNGSYDSLVQLSFWKRMIQERKDYLELLANKAHNSGNAKSLEIVNWVKNNSEKFNAELFRKLFEDYFTNRKVFLNFYSSL